MGCNHSARKEERLSLSQTQVTLRQKLSERPTSRVRMRSCSTAMLGPVLNMAESDCLAPSLRDMCSLTKTECPEQRGSMFSRLEIVCKDTAHRAHKIRHPDPQKQDVDEDETEPEQGNHVRSKPKREDIDKAIPLSEPSQPTEWP